MCEDCREKRAHYGKADSKQRQWCGTCAERQGGVRLDGIGCLDSGLKFRVRSREDHPGPEGPGVVPSRILGAGPGLGAGPDQVFRVR